ncbi:hypothetical protein D3C84_799850 [compost metagenome]
MLNCRDLRNRVNEAVVHEFELVIFAFFKAFDSSCSQSLDIGKRRRVGKSNYLFHKVNIAASEVVTAFTSDNENIILSRRLVILLNLRPHFTKHVGVVAACQTAVRRDDQVSRTLDLAGLQHRMLDRAAARCNACYDVLDLVRVWTRCYSRILRSLELCGRDHLHRFRDLLRILRTLDRALNFAHTFSHSLSPPYYRA